MIKLFSSRVRFASFCKIIWGGSRLLWASMRSMRSCIRIFCKFLKKSLVLMRILHRWVKKTRLKLSTPWENLRKFLLRVWNMKKRKKSLTQSLFWRTSTKSFSITDGRDHSRRLFSSEFLRCSQTKSEWMCGSWEDSLYWQEWWGFGSYLESRFLDIFCWRLFSQELRRIIEKGQY